MGEIKTIGEGDNAEPTTVTILNAKTIAQQFCKPHIERASTMAIKEQWMMIQVNLENTIQRFGLAGVLQGSREALDRIYDPDPVKCKANAEALAAEVGFEVKVSKDNPIIKP